MRSLSTEVVVLKVTPFGESDAVVSLFARDAGVLSAMAKGARRSRKRFGGSLDFLSRLQATIQWRKSNAMPLLAAASLIDFGLGIRSDLERVARASYMSELIWRGTKPGVKMAELYGSFSLSLSRLADSDPSEEDLARFLLVYQTSHGYRPKLEVCSLCQDRIDVSATNYGPRTTDHGFPMSYKSGGVVCPRCLDGAEINMRMSPNSLLWLQSLGRTPSASFPPSIHDSRFTIHDCESALQFLHRFTVYHLEFQPASWRWWHRIIESDER